MTTPYGRGILRIAEDRKPPFTLEYKQQIGTISIFVNQKMVDARKQYTITFFFEHMITGATYSRTILKSELYEIFPTFRSHPGLVHVYIESEPEIRECPTMVVMIFAYKAHPTYPKLSIPIPMDFLEKS